MNRILNKKINFENCIYILLSILILVYGVYILNNNLIGVRIFKGNILGIILIVVSIAFIITEIILLIIKKYNKVKRIIFLIILFLSTLIVFDIFILGIVRSFIIASSLEKRPTTLDPLNIRLAYICIKNYQAILNGIWTTIWLSMVGTIIGLVIGLLFITIKKVEIKDNECEFIKFIKRIGITFVDVYVTVFRGTPMMVQAIIIYYFLPGILSSIFKIDQQVLNEILSVSIAGVITVTLNTTAYLTEVLRGGIESLNKGQMEAARSLGMSRRKANLYIILPQAIKNSLPSICNEFIINIKDTSVLSVISVMDLFFVIDSINGRNASQDGIFIAAIIYLFLTFVISKLLRLLEKRMNLVSKPLPSCN